MRFGLFRYYTKLDTKRAELVQLKQKFVPRSRIRIFHNERTRSTPLDPKFMFWCVRTIWCIWDHLVDLRNSVQNGPNWCKSSHHEVASEFFATNARDPPPLDPKLMFWCVSYNFDAFWTVWLPYKTWCKNGPNRCKSSCHEVASEFFAMNAPDPPH